MLSLSDRSTRCGTSPLAPVFQVAREEASSPLPALLSVGHGQVRWGISEMIRPSTCDESAAHGDSPLPLLKPSKFSIKNTEGLFVECDSIPEVDFPHSWDRYGPVEGLPALREAALAVFGGWCPRIALDGFDLSNDPRECVVTGGSNQAFLDLVTALCDAGDACLLLEPYFFNHAMACQLTSVAVVGVKCLADFLPDFASLEEQIRSFPRAKMLVVVNPSNPSGAVFSADILKRLLAITQKHGLWLVSDEAYAGFVFDEEDRHTPEEHFTPRGTNVITLHSMSKVFGAAGWRIGFIMFSKAHAGLLQAIAKVQDTVPINAPAVSQRMALAALQSETVVAWARKNVSTLTANRDRMWKAITSATSSYWPSPVKTRGGLYFLVKCPPNVTDLQAMEHLARKSRVLVVPCIESGLTGYLRVAYGNLSDVDCEEASIRLEQGLRELAATTAQ